MTDFLAERLASEVEALLGVSSVGLYEFGWILNGWRDAPSLNRASAICTSALSLLMRSDDVVLVAKKWPNEVTVRPYSPDKDGPLTWEVPSGGKYYIAIERDQRPLPA